MAANGQTLYIFHRCFEVHCQTNHIVECARCTWMVNGWGHTATVAALPAQRPIRFAFLICTRLRACLKSLIHMGITVNWCAFVLSVCTRAIESSSPNGGTQCPWYVKSNQFECKITHNVEMYPWSAINPVSINYARIRNRINNPREKKKKHQQKR